MKIKLSNIPIPESHVIGLVLGYILQKLVGLIDFPASLLIARLGWFLLIAGLGFSVWAVIVAGNSQVSNPENLITSGPYAISRNPMYLGWLDIYIGLVLILNAPWIILLLPIVLAFNHFVDIQKEERFLTEKFGEEYVAYQKKVRRYL